VEDPLAVAEELMALTTRLATERRLGELLGSVVASARRLTRAEGGRVLVLDRSGRFLQGMVGQNETAPDAADLDEAVPLYIDGSAFNMADPSVFSVVTGRIVNLPDIDQYTGFDFSPLREQDRRTGYRTRSFVAAPLWSVEGVSLGVLQLVNLRLTPDGEVGALPETFERLVGSFAAHAAVAIANARLFEENRQLIRQLDRRASQLAEENVRLRDSAPFAGDDEVVGDAPNFRAALDLARRAANSSVAVLLLGETGTGKDVLARAIHRLGARAARPFVAQNCAALPETLLESELFGHRKGAFSGAVADKKGLVQEAHGGTLFLDEIGDMPLSLQAKILRLLEDGSVRRLGDTRTERVDLRIIAATNVDLRQKIGEGGFREDLFYRLNVFPIHLPPLRQRASDIPKLVDHFATRLARRQGRTPIALTPRALDALCSWRYPGNIRELRNIVERASLLADEGERIDCEHLPPELGASRPEVQTPAASMAVGASLRSALRHYEAIVIETRLRESGWNQSRAARLLQISRRSLVDKLQRYAIRPPGEFSADSR
jgi:sigma-54 dependent transcriptional regulator